MIARVQRWLGAPELEDSELRRQAGLLSRILAVLIPATICLALLLTVLAPHNLTGRNIALGAILVEFITLALLRRGWVQFAGICMLLALWGCISAAMYWGEGVRSVSMLGQILMIFMAGLLVNGSFASTLALLTILWNYVTVLLHTQNGEPPTLLLDMHAYWAVQSLFFIMSVGLTLTYVNRLRVAFDEAQAKEDSLTTRVSELHAAQQAQSVEESHLRRKEAILKAVSRAAEQLFRQHSFAESIQDVLRDLGQATGVDRVRIFENAPGSGDNLMSHELAAWANSNVSEYMQLGRFKSTHFREVGLSRWVDLLSNNRVVSSRVKDLPDGERRRLQSQGLKSILLVPIFVRAAWWGFIGFDEIKTEREWTLDEEEALRAAAGILGGVIERQQVERALHRSQQHYLAILQDQTDMICRYSPQGLITFANEAYERFFNLPPKGAEHRPIWNQMLNQEEAEALRAKIDSISVEHPATTSRNLSLRADGVLRWIEWISRGIFDENGVLVEVQAAGRDVDNEVRLREQLERSLRETETQAMTDALTGLHNRRAITERAELEWRGAMQAGLPFSLILLDLDHLKEINDTHGHLMGDEALKLVGTLLKTSMRRNDVAGRWGGDEFMLLLPGSDQEVALQVAERLRQRIGQAHLRLEDGETLTLQVSLGVVSDRAGAHAETPDGLFAKADRALYRAKQAGRNRVGVA